MNHIVWALFAVLKFLLFGGRMKFTLKSGEVLQDEAHGAWRDVEINFTTSCVDLKSACKQLPLHEKNHRDAVVTIWNPKNKCTECFIMKVLPFGAAASVHHFLRVSAFLQAVDRFIGLMWAAFFDDFVMVSHAMHEFSTMSSALSLFDILGFQYSREQLTPFETKTEMLGVELDLQEARVGSVKIRHKPSPTSELCGVLEEILNTGKVEVKSLPSTIGKLQLAEGQLWCRAGRLALAELRSHEKAGTREACLDSRSLKAARLLLEKLRDGKPRAIQISERSRPFILFTDGSLEYDTSGNAISGIGA